MDETRPSASSAPDAADVPGPGSTARSGAGAALNVSALPPWGEVLAQLTEQLAAWMPDQRWYAHKGAGTPRVSIHGWAPLRVAPDHVVVLVAVAVVLEHGGEALSQVPLVLRHPQAPAGSREEGSEVGVVAVPGGPLRADDAARDADGRAAIIAALVSGEGALGHSLSLASHRATPGAPLPLGRAMRSRLLAGEQSNTSLIVETEGASPLIVKLFRVLQDGENPDVVLQGALTAVGSRQVPALVGSATIAVGGIRTHSLLAQEFLPGVEDAWRVALRLAAAGEDFREAAHRLGIAVAEVHRDLADSLGTTIADPSLVQEMVSQMRRRLSEISAEVPQVSRHQERIGALLDSAAQVRWPAMQRIHGDLHLGQALLVPERGWVLLDFEGEPLRPLAQRNLPDSPLRDVAGMLRSLDYAAGAVLLEYGKDATEWATATRTAFSDGYAQGAGWSEGDDALPILLAAFEADKAVYEALYEARNRPDWLPIPLAALERISAPAAEAGSAG